MIGNPWFLINFFVGIKFDDWLLFTLKSMTLCTTFVGMFCNKLLENYLSIGPIKGANQGKQTPFRPEGERER